MRNNFSLIPKKGIHFIEDLNGIFAFALYDKQTNNYLIARDHIGIIPLYMGWDNAQNLYIASVLKALEGVCNQFQEFPPGALPAQPTNTRTKTMVQTQLDSISKCRKQYIRYQYT